MLKKRCPECGAKTFIVKATVVQDWLVDTNGKFVKCKKKCVEIVHKPNESDIWVCNVCGYRAAGRKFNVSQA